MADAPRISDPAPRLVDGVLHLEGQPRICFGTDYHYFRDDPANWRDRLRAQAEAGVHLLTVYVPWRHHAPEDPLRGGGTYDFEGRTDPRRDVKRLLRIAREEGLQVFLKPGPFVHAELPYGGLPEYVRPDLNPAIEAELDGDGLPVTWSLRRMLPRSRHPVPAPFGDAYNDYVRGWLTAVARELIVPFYWPEGPVVGLQLLNEGIYSDSARAEPHQLGFSPSTLARFRDFVRERYESLERYNRCHNTSLDEWAALDPPRAAHTMERPEDLLAYLDWSAFQAVLYTRVADLYRGYLLEGGIPENAPLVFNFNPNGETYRERPASNDGWYTRVNVSESPCFTFGTTNWIGVVAGDEMAYRQFVMALTSFRGPAMELNWGFTTLYDPLYQYETPTHFETMTALACGATGAVAYTLSGTRAWRHDPNLAGEWLPERMSSRFDETAGDYPGAPPVMSNGERRSKYWTLRQVAQWFGHEGRRFVKKGVHATVAWGIYPPYAWAGQWLPRGEPDDLLWRPPLRTIPRGAYHGLDAFVELMVQEGAGFQQVDVSDPLTDASRYRALCLGAHEFMDAETQRRLADYVEGGGTLLLTNQVPTRDLHLGPLRGDLAERLFPHRSEQPEILRPTLRLEGFGGREAFAQDFFTPVEPPADAEPLVHGPGGEVVGYRRRVGAGEAFFLGFDVWRARLSGDDLHISNANQALVRDLLHRYVGESAFPAHPVDHAGEASVWQHGDPETGQAHLFVLVREGRGEIEAEFTGAGGARHRLRLASPSQAAHAVALEKGEVVACYLKGVNDLRAERVAPRVEAAGRMWGAEDPCDLCLTRSPDGSGLTITVAHLEGPETRVRLPLPPEVVGEVACERGAAAPPEPVDGGLALPVRDVREAGGYRLRLVAAPPLPA